METTIPRIQFRLSKVNDQDLLDVLNERLSSGNTDLTKEAKRLMRLGIQHERLQNKYRTKLS